MDNLCRQRYADNRIQHFGSDIEWGSNLENRERGIALVPAAPNGEKDKVRLNGTCQ